MEEDDYDEDSEDNSGEFYSADDTDTSSDEYQEIGPDDEMILPPFEDIRIDPENLENDSDVENEYRKGATGDGNGMLNVIDKILSQNVSGKNTVLPHRKTKLVKEREAEQLRRKAEEKKKAEKRERRQGRTKRTKRQNKGKKEEPASQKVKRRKRAAKKKKKTRVSILLSISYSEFPSGHWLGQTNNPEASFVGNLCSLRCDNVI